MTIGERIRKARTQRGWSMRQLADAVGCNTASVCNWENGHTMPQLDKICDVAQALHTTVEALCGRAEYCSTSEVAELKREIVRLKKALYAVRGMNQDICDVIRETIFPDPLMGGE